MVNKVYIKCGLVYPIGGDNHILQVPLDNEITDQLIKGETIVYLIESSNYYKFVFQRVEHSTKHHYHTKPHIYDFHPSYDAFKHINKRHILTDAKKSKFESLYRQAKIKKLLKNGTE